MTSDMHRLCIFVEAKNETEAREIMRKRLYNLAFDEKSCHQVDVHGGHTVISDIVLDPKHDLPKLQKEIAEIVETFYCEKFDGFTLIEM